MLTVSRTYSGKVATARGGRRAKNMAKTPSLERESLARATHVVCRFFMNARFAASVCSMLASLVLWRGGGGGGGGGGGESTAQA